MVWEFPAVSQSRIDFWKKPQYSQSSLLTITVLFGFFGFHHLYLRSPQTALLFFFGNILTLGYWFWYDLIQFSRPLEELNTFGLSTPFGPAGIAQGMFTNNTNSEKEDTSTPNPLYFLLYALALPILPLGRFIAGDKNNSLLALFNFTNPFGILFNFIGMLSEYFYLFFKPAELLYSGIVRTFPFNYIGFAKTGFSKMLTGRELEPAQCENSGVFFRLFKAIMSSLLLVFGRFLPPELVNAIESALQIGKFVKEQVVDTAIDVAQTTLKTATKVGELATQIPSIAATSLADSASKISTLTQQGGGDSASFTDYAIGGATVALLLGGFLLQTGRSLTDAYRLSFGKDDSPPSS